LGPSAITLLAAVSTDHTSLMGVNGLSIRLLMPFTKASSGSPPAQAGRPHSTQRGKDISWAPKPDLAVIQWQSMATQANALGHAQAADKGLEPLLLPSNYAANQRAGPGGRSCIIKVPSTALQIAVCSAFSSGVQLHAQAATATRGNEPGGLALLSKRTATNGHKQVDAHASSRSPALPCVMLAGQLIPQGCN
jgi:hypothetical protein